MHQHDEPKFVRDLHTRIEDSLESIRAVKGETFADIVYVSFMGAHATKMVGSVLLHSDVSDEARDAVGRQLAHAIAAFMSLIASHAKLTQQDCKDLMTWSDTLCDHVGTAIKEAK